MQGRKTLDKNTPIPLYFQLESMLLEEIQNGTYPIGSAIPTEKELCEMFDVSRTTVSQAIRNLVKKGQLHRMKHHGTFVSQPEINQPFYKSVISFDNDVRQAGQVPSTEVLSLRIIPLPQEIAHLTAYPEGSQTIFLHRKRLVNGVPLAQVKTYLPYSIGLALLKRDFSKESLYHMLGENSHTKVVRVTRYYEACVATEEDRAILSISEHSPIQKFHTFGYNWEGTLVEFSISHYIGSSSKFKVEVLQE